MRYFFLNNPRNLICFLHSLCYMKTEGYTFQKSLLTIKSHTLYGEIDFL